MVESGKRIFDSFKYNKEKIYSHFDLINDIFGFIDHYHSQYVHNMCEDKTNIDESNVFSRASISQII